MEVQFNADGTPFVMWGGNKIQVEDEIIDKFYLEKAKEELRETPEIVQKALAELRKLLKGDTALVIPIERDDFLMKFLRPCKFYPESAFKRIQAYYKFRKSHREYCHDLMPSAVRPAFDHSIVSIMSPRDQHGRRIMVVESGARTDRAKCALQRWAKFIDKPIHILATANLPDGVDRKHSHQDKTLAQAEKWNPRHVSLIEVFRGVQLGLEAAMVEPMTQVNGVITILDMKGLSLSQVMQFTPFFAKMVVDWIQDCVPIRLKAVHIVNQPYIFNMLFAIFKPFMRQKLRSRIHFHGTDHQSLLSHIDVKATRKRHGGDLPDPEIPGETLWKMLYHYEEQFKVANSYGYTSVNNK